MSSRCHKGAASLLMIILPGAFAVSCGMTPSETPEPPRQPPPDAGWETQGIETQVDKAPAGAACARVESALVQALGSDQPLGVLEDEGYSVRDGRIQVVLSLATDDISFLEAWDVEVGTRSGLRIQIFARPEDICEIAGSENVNFVRLPSLAVPQ